MATQEQKDKKVTAAEKRLGAAQKRLDKFSAKVLDIEALEKKEAALKLDVETKTAEVEWIKAQPVSGVSDTDSDGGAVAPF